MDKDSAFLKKLLATFKVEAAEHIQAISTGLIELEQSPSSEAQTRTVERIFRESHSMKGAARSVGLTDVENVCQAMESVLAALKRREIASTRELLDLLHLSVNVLGELLAGIEGTRPVPDRKKIRDLTSRLSDAARARPSGVEIRAMEEQPSHYQTAQREEAWPTAFQPGSADVMRVSKEKLHSLMLQGEAFLSVKQSIAQQAAELRAITAAVQTLRKEWTKMPPEIREYVRDNAGNDAASLPNEKKKKLLDFFEKQDERISKIAHGLSGLSTSADRDLRSIGSLVDGFLEDMKTVSLLPFSSVLEIMPKIVRDLSHDQGKEARFASFGGELEMDKRILDELREPLIHLVRNCVDHGIEKSEARTAQKKPPAGTINIEVKHRDGKTVEVAVSDDGQGIDQAAVRNSAIKSGVLSRGEADALNDEQTLELMFRSGVTTSPLITDISGRGLGLAIVREHVEKLGGTVFCESTVGQGTMFRMLLPLTLATFRGVLVRVADSQYVIPTFGLERTVRVQQDEIKTVENRETIVFDGRTVPFVPLRAVLELPPEGKNSEVRAVTHAAVLGTGGYRIAFEVDEVLGEQEVLVKDLGRQLRRVRNISGATVLGTGKVVLILNISDLLKTAVRISSTARPIARAEEVPLERKSLLVVEDSITSRTLLKNILEASGYDVQTAVDGVDALTKIKTGTFDLVISDVDMPRMNGFDLTAKIRADKKLADMPIVLVTALESRDDRERGVEVGANAYIVKSSFDKSNLLEAIKRLI